MTFYQLTPETGKTLIKNELTAAEWRVWIYLVCLDPWGNEYKDLNSLEIMSECKVSKTTLWRAMSKLQDLGLFDFQDQGFHFKNETGVSKMKQEFQKRNRNFKNETEISKMKQKFQKRNRNFKNETEISKMKFSSPEMQTESDSDKPLDLLDYKDLIRSLSEEEREKFLNFVKEETKNFPTPICDINAWLAATTAAGENRWEIYWANYSNRTQKPKENPQHLEWQRILDEEGDNGLFLPVQDNPQEYQARYKWRFG